MSQWKIISDCNLYFVTTTIVGWQYVFTSQDYFSLLIDSLQFCNTNKGLTIHAYVIMLNHAHYIFSMRNALNLSDVMRDFNTHTSREITGLLKRDGKKSLLRVFSRAARAEERENTYKVWQTGFHPIALESEEFFLQKVEYIHNNPVRKGFLEEPEHWLYSSARNYYLNDHSILKVEILP